MGDTYTATEMGIGSQKSTRLGVDISLSGDD